MRAVRFDRFGGPLELALVPEPSCPDDGAVVQVEATGVCRSDWHAWQGHDPEVTLPHVPGHELAGHVVEVGPLVRRWRPGDRVTVPFVSACGECETCLAGEHQVCPFQTQPGFTHDGSFAERVALRHADVNLVRLPDGMTAVTAAALGCRFATAYRALMAHGRVLAGEWVVVHGCGGLGLSLVMIAAAGGARVLAVDVSPTALGAARDAGAAEVLDVTGMTPEVVGAHVAELTGGGAHVSVDACGSAATAVASVLSLRRRGRHVQAGLLLGSHAHAPLPMGRVIAWELQLFGTHGMAAHDYPTMLGQVTAGVLRPEKLVTRTVPLELAPAALEAFSRAGGTPGITVVTPT